MTVKVKVLGERNSGTNFLETTLRENFVLEMFPHIKNPHFFDNLILNNGLIPRTIRNLYQEYIEDKNHEKGLPDDGGWKHALVTERFIGTFFRPQGCQVIASVRHPLAWARSMQKNPFHVFGKVPQDFAEFLQMPWKTRPRDEMGGVTLDSPLELWGRKAATYVRYAEEYENFHLLRYEDLLLKPQETFAELSGFLPLQPYIPALPTHTIRKFVDNELPHEEYKAKARTTGLAELDGETRALFHKHIDPELLQRLDYS